MKNILKTSFTKNLLDDCEKNITRRICNAKMTLVFKESPLDERERDVLRDIESMEISFLSLMSSLSILFDFESLPTSATEIVDVGEEGE